VIDDYSKGTRNMLFNIEFRLIFKRLILAERLFMKYGTFRKLFNVIRLEWEKFLSRKISLNRPYFIKIQVTNRCDAGCLYCLRSDLQYPAADMEYGDFKVVIDKVKKYACLIAFHFSGEPLLHSKIYEMVNYAHRQNIATYISTNLQHFRIEDTQRMMSCGLDLLTVSVDGATEYTYQRYRKNGIFGTVLKNTRQLVRYKKRLGLNWPIINMQFLVMEHNEHEIKDIKNIAVELGVDSLELKPLGSWDRSLLPKEKKYLRSIYLKKVSRRINCWWLWSALVVLWNGDVISCCMEKPDQSVGNLIQSELVAIQNSRLRQNLRISNLNGSPSLCNDCPIPYYNSFYQIL